MNKRKIVLWAIWLVLVALARWQSDVAWAVLVGGTLIYWPMRLGLSVFLKNKPTWLAELTIWGLWLASQHIWLNLILALLNLAIRVAYSSYLFFMSLGIYALLFLLHIYFAVQGSRLERWGVVFLGAFFTFFALIFCSLVWALGIISEHEEIREGDKIYLIGRESIGMLDSYHHKYLVISPYFRSYTPVEYDLTGEAEHIYGHSYEEEFGLD